MKKILTINPGSTSTKIAVYEDAREIMRTTIQHTPEELAHFPSALAQREYRRDLVIQTLTAQGIGLDFDAVVGRGGLAKPIASGVYYASESMCADMYRTPHRHACNLGCIIASELAERIGNGCLALIADPGNVNELLPEAKLCGAKGIERICIWHALNQKAVARRFAAEHGTRYEDLRLIMCHLGGGISIAAHADGLAIDANNALNGEGPFTPERSGTLPVQDLIHLCYSGQYTERELLSRLIGNGGLRWLIGTNDVRAAIERAEGGDEEVRLALNAMLFHTAKAIASEGAVLEGRVDAIILTGGMAHAAYVTDYLRQRIQYLAPVYVYPGEDEMLALAESGLAVLRGEREVKDYGEPLYKA